jgi:hypothetical protein
MRACSDAMPSRPRSALQRRAFWPRRCRGPCNVAKAFRVRETCIHAVPVKRSQFPLSKVPSFQDTRKKKGAVPVQKHRGSRRHCAGKLGGAFWEYFSFQEPALVKWSSKSSRFQIPRLAPDFGELDSFQKPAQAIQNPDSAPRRGFWNLDRFQVQISPCRIQLTHLALRFGN